MNIAPNHIREFCFSLSNDDLPFYKLSKFHSDEVHFIYKIKCNCGCENFKLLIDDHPSADAFCENCNTKIIIYDLDLYSASSKANFETYKKELSIKGVDTFKICVLYEYSDEFGFSDQRFDINNITWFNLWVYNNKWDTYIEIIDDETA